MSNLVILEDGGAWKAAGWAWQRTLRLIGSEVIDAEFAVWLEEFAEENRNVCDLDLRELAPALRPDFMEGAKRAHRRAAVDDGSDWPDPRFLDGWRERLAELIQMIESFERHVSTEDVRSIREDIPARAHRLGPGWERVGSETRDD